MFLGGAVLSLLASLVNGSCSRGVGAALATCESRLLVRLGRRATYDQIDRATEREVRRGDGRGGCDPVTSLLAGLAGLLGWKGLARASRCLGRDASIDTVQARRPSGVGGSARGSRE